MEKKVMREPIAPINKVVNDFFGNWILPGKKDTSVSFSEVINKQLISLVSIFFPEGQDYPYIHRGSLACKSDVEKIIRDDIAAFSVFSRISGIAAPKGFRSLNEMNILLSNMFFYDCNGKKELKSNAGDHLKTLRYVLLKCPKPTENIDKNGSKPFEMISKIFLIYYIVCRYIAVDHEKYSLERAGNFSVLMKSVEAHIDCVPEYFDNDECRRALSEDNEQVLFWKAWMIFYTSRKSGKMRADDDIKSTEREMLNALIEKSEKICDSPINVGTAKFNTFKNHYIPVDLTKRGYTNDKGQYFRAEKGNTRGIFELLNRAETLRMAVLASAGYGKTTLCKAIAAHYISPDKSTWSYRTDVKGNPIEIYDGRRLPFIISCSSLTVKKGTPFTAYMTQICAASGISNDCTAIKICSANAKEGKLLLIIDGLEDIHASPDSTFDETCNEFLRSLNEFLAELPDTSCLITSLPDTYSQLDTDSKFEVYSLCHFNPQKIRAYCHKWFNMSASKNANAEVGASKLADKIISTSSLRRIMHRPIFLYYMLSTVDTVRNDSNDAMIYMHKSPVYLMRSISSSAIRSLNTAGFCKKMGISDFDEKDIKASLALMAFVMMHNNLVHVTAKDIGKILESVGSHLDTSLSLEACLRKEKGVKLFIDNILDKLPVFKHTGTGDERIYSFASRPLLWYYASYAIYKGLICIGEGNTDSFCDGYLSENWSGDAALHYLSKFFRCRSNMAHSSDTLDDWCTLVSWTAIGLDLGCGKVVEMLAEHIHDPSVKNRRIRETALRILPDILSQRPSIGPELKKKAYDTSFCFFFYKRQREAVHNILASSDRWLFVDHVCNEFENSSNSMYPHYIWLMGYLDWLDLSRSGSEGDILPKGYSLRGSIIKEKSKSMIDSLIDYIRSESGKRPQSLNTRSLVRAVTALCTFLWLRVYETNTDTYYQQVHYTEPIKNINGICELLISLLSIRGCCVSNIACYALAHIITAAEALDAQTADRISDKITSNLDKVILTDYVSRYLQKEYPEHTSSKFFTEQPLCGALRLITALPVKLCDKADMMNEYSVNTSGHGILSPTAEDIRDFYRERWEFYACGSTGETRYAMLLFKLCYLLRAWDEKETKEKFEFILSEAEKAGEPFSLRYDRFDRFKDLFSQL